MKHEKSCGAVVVQKNTNSYKVLLIQHVNGGHWSFPKGHVEKDEKETETALREIKEETGLDVVIDSGFRYIITYCPDKETTKDVVYFIAVPSDNQIILQEEEVIHAGWYSFEEALKIITYNNDIQLLTSAIAYLTSEKSVSSQNTYVAEVINSDQGTLGGDTQS